jgi:hypothetical protein
MTYSGAKALMSMGPSRPTLYEVTLPEVGGNVNDYLRFFCKATFIPEVRVERIAAVGHDAIGIERQQGTRIMYGKPFEITIIENSEFEVYKGIRRWFDTVASNVNRGSGGGGGVNSSQRMSYYDTIVRDMTLTKLENPANSSATLGSNNLRRVLEVTFKNAYPVRMGSIQLASDAFNSFTEFTAAFTYETYSYE